MITRSIQFHIVPALALLVAIGLSPQNDVWAQRDLKDIPIPDPELERKSFIVADGLEVNLYAADPLMAKPIQMNFDADGRLWVASSEVYPQIKPGQPATDKILVLEDTNQDGQADKTTVFADGLLIPTAVVPDIRGVYVANSTELLYLSDTNGDGKADRRRTVLSGFGTEDTHHLLHTFRWGHDGCLYMNQSIYIHSHVETPYGVKRLNGGGIWRFRPETLQLEVLCYGFVNSWGHHFDAWGQSFATDGAYGEGINYVFPGSSFFTAVGAKRISSGLNPGSPKHCGLEIVSGRHLPDDWQGNMITNDFRAHRVCRFVVTDDASGYASRQEVELIKTSHVAFRPIDVKMGPDGAIYIADWYNPIIQHGEVDFRDPRRDHVHGRIWRVTAKGRPPLKYSPLTQSTTEDLLDALKVPEEWTRLHAKLILKSRDKATTLSLLQTWLAGLDKQDPVYEHHRLEALWLYESLDTVEPRLLKELLPSSDFRVRAAAVRVASHWRERLEGAVDTFSRAAQDAHPRVRLEAVRALAGVNSVKSAEAALSVLDRPMDKNLDLALWQTMRDLESSWLPEVVAGRNTFGDRFQHLLFALKAIDSPAIVSPLITLIRENKVPPDESDEVLSLIASHGGPKELSIIFDLILDSKSNISLASKTSLLNGLRETTLRRRVQPEGDVSRVSVLLNSANEGLRAAAARAAGVWKVDSQRARLESWLLGSQPVTPLIRDAAFDALTNLGGEASIELMSKLSAPGKPLDLRERAIHSLTVLRPLKAAERAIELFQSRDTVHLVDPLVQSLLAQRSGAESLAIALAGHPIPPDSAKRMLRTVQRSPSPNADLLASIQQAGRLKDAGWKATPELIQELVAEVQTKGDAQRGEIVYQRVDTLCTKCHAIAGAGGRVGPDLVSIGATAQIDYLLMSLLAPNDKVKENFHALVIETDAGQIVSGIPVRETKTELVLRDGEDREVTIPTKSIELRREGRSLMPDGSVDSLTRDELVDLTRFLSELGKVGKYAVGPQQVARRWQVLEWSAESNQLLNRNSYDIASTENSVFNWRPTYSQVGGDLLLDGLPTFTPHRDLDPATFVRCQLDVSADDSIPLKVDTAGLMLWIDGKPTRFTPKLQLSKGRHTLTFAVNRKLRSEPLRVEIPESAGPGTQKGQFVLGK